MERGDAMDPVPFEGQTTVLKRPPSMTDEECGELPVYHSRAEGYCLSCWELSEEDLATILKTKKVLLWVRGGRTQPPVSVQVENPFKPGAGEGR